MHYLKKTTLSGCLLVLLAATAVSASAAEPVPAKGRYTIHIMTIDPGEELFMRFGHIAVVVQDHKDKSRRVYNFGTYDFEDPDLRFQYARGFLTYWLSVVPYREMIRWYREDNRSMTLRTLNLTPEQAEQMATRLRINARPENAEYAYRHYLDNCCTRIRDILDEVLGGAIKRQFGNVKTGRTFRYWTRRALRGMPIYQNVILFSLGPAIDKPLTRWDEQFLPEVLVADLDRMTVGPDNRPLVIAKKRLLKSSAPPVGTITYGLDIGVAIGLFGLLALGFALPIVLRRPRLSPRLIGAGLVTWGLFSGLAGFMLILYWTATTHYDTHYNENLLIMPPLNLWLLGPGFKLLVTARLSPRTARMVRGYLLVAIGLIAADLLLKIGPFFQGNLEFLAFSAAVSISACFALQRNVDAVTMPPASAPPKAPEAPSNDTE